MPAYRRIPPPDRWAVVNYVRHLQGGGEPIQVSSNGADVVLSPYVDAAIRAAEFIRADAGGSASPSR